jgi:hypothetical protein
MTGEKRQKKPPKRFINGNYELEDMEENAPARAEHASTRTNARAVRAVQALPNPPRTSQGSSQIVLDLGGGVSTLVDVFQDGTFNESKYHTNMRWKIKNALKSVMGPGRGIYKTNYRQKVEQQMGVLAPPITHWQGRYKPGQLVIKNKDAEKKRRVEAYERLRSKSAPLPPAQKTGAQKKASKASKVSKVISRMSKRMGDFPDNFAGYEAEVTIKNPRNAAFFQEQYGKNAEKMYEGMMGEAGQHAMYRNRKELELELVVARELAKRYPTPGAKKRVRTLREALNIQKSMS